MSRHILHAMSSFDVGGPQVRLVSLAGALKDRFSHTILAMDGLYAAGRLLDPDVQVQYIDGPGKGGSLPSRLGRYRKMIQGAAPDLLVTYNWGAIEWALANAPAGVPHIHIEDGFGPEEVRRQIPRRVWMRRLALRRSQVIVPSLVLRDIALKVWRLNPRHVEYIPNGIAPRDHFETSLTALCDDLPEGLPKIVSAGAIRPEKNVSRLLRAFAPLRDQAVLIIVGDGPDMPTVRAAVDQLGLGEHVRLLGHRNDARDLIMQADIMALSSDTEQMPLAVLEAMDAGLPVAAVDVGDVRQMVSAENRPLVTAVDDEALMAAMRTLIGDPVLRADLGARNRARARSDYSLSSMVAAYGSAFERSAGPLQASPPSGSGVRRRGGLNMMSIRDPLP